MSIFWQHHLNPLHIFCRLRGIGLPKTVAILICRFYERVIFKKFLANKENLKITTVNISLTETMSNGSWLK